MNLRKLPDFGPLARRPQASAPPRVHKARQRLSSETIAQLVADYQAGYSTRQLMVTYHLGKGTVLRLLREEGVQLRYQSLTDDQVHEAIRLYEQGWSLAKVGAYFGRDASLIHLLLKRAGVPRRGR